MSAALEGGCSAHGSKCVWEAGGGHRGQAKGAASAVPPQPPLGSWHLARLVPAEVMVVVAGAVVAVVAVAVAVEAAVST